MKEPNQSTMTLPASAPVPDGTAAGEALKQEGQQKVARHSSEFMERAKKIVEDVFAKPGRPFTFTQVRLYCAQSGVLPNHPNAWGALPRSCRTFIKLVPSMPPEKSSIASAHARKLPFYIGA